MLMWKEQVIMLKVLLESCSTVHSSTKERDDASTMAHSYRNHVHELQAKNRRLHCEMNDRVDVIRNFWHNKIAEGSSRARCCVQRNRRKDTKT